MVVTSGSGEPAPSTVGAPGLATTRDRLTTAGVWLPAHVGRITGVPPKECGRKWHVSGPQKTLRSTVSHASRRWARVAHGATTAVGPATSADRTLRSAAMLSRRLPRVARRAAIPETYELGRFRVRPKGPAADALATTMERGPPLAGAKKWPWGDAPGRVYALASCVARSSISAPCAMVGYPYGRWLWATPGPNVHSKSPARHVIPPSVQTVDSKDAPKWPSCRATSWDAAFYSTASLMLHVSGS
jgi:hypothetical protein